MVISKTWKPNCTQLFGHIHNLKPKSRPNIQILIVAVDQRKTLLQMPSKIVRMETVCRMWHIRFFCVAMLQHMQRLVSVLDNSCSNTVQQSVQISLVGQAKQPRLEMLEKSWLLRKTHSTKIKRKNQPALWNPQRR